MLIRPASPGELGAVPLAVPLVAGGLVAMATWDPLLQLLGLKAAPTLAPTPSALKPPPAPITAAAQRTWTPTMLYESVAQRAEEQQETHAQVAAPTLPSPQPAAKQPSGAGWVLWLALALAGGAFIFAILPRGGH